MIPIKTTEEVEALRQAGLIHRQVMDKLAAEVKPGVSTFELDRMAAQLIKSFGAKASFLGYQGFPASICTSINDEVVHGIPSPKRILQNGDLLKLDMGVYIGGMHADAGRTVLVGEVKERARQLAERTKDAFFAGVQQVAPGNKINQIGRAIEAFIKPFGYGIVRQLIGHGVGRELHEAPEIPNYYRPDLQDKMAPGMVLAIEPMINQGSFEVNITADKWTIVSADRSLSAYFEHTVLVTEQGYEIIT